MFDPLNSTANIFAEDGTNGTEQGWQAAPDPAAVDFPGLQQPSTPSFTDRSDVGGPSPGLYGKQPQIYGQPEAGLISPRETVASNGSSFEPQQEYLRVRITGLDRNRRDILIKLDAQTNLANFTGSTYRNISRSYYEFQQFYDTIIHSNPQTIIPALPLAQTSAPTDEEDDRLVRIMIQRWMTRVCEDPILLHDEELRSFIENDFGYQPNPRPRKRASSGFGIMGRRNVPDEDEELQRARFELTKLEGQFFDTAKAVDRLAATRKTLAGAHAEMGNKLINVATTEAHPPLANAFRKIGRAWHSLADLDQAQALSESVILGDSLGYQGMNARSAKETLLMRAGVLEEYQAAVKTTISKRRNIERLKASSNIRPERVDEALEEIEEAQKYETTLARRAEGISQNLHVALQKHNRHANDDITTALIEHARSSIMYERQLLKELEALRVDVSNANKKHLPASNGPPKPTIIPPLEDFSRPPMPSAPPAQNGFQRNGQQQPYPHQGMVGPQGGRPVLTSSQSYTYDPLGQPAQPYVGPPRGPPSASIPNSPSTPPLGPQMSPHPRPLTPSQIQAQTQAQARAASPRPTPIAAPPPSDGPPLGGHLVGSRSMFIKPPGANTNVTTTPSVPSPLSASFSQAPRQGQGQSPIQGLPPTGLGDPLLGGGPVPVHQSQLQSQPRGYNSQTISAGSGPNPPHNGLDPLGQSRIVGGSVRGFGAPPQRPRLDAREAASKLANMF